MESQKKIIQNKRPVKTFEAEADVAEMLEMAQEDGLTIGEICNRALKKHGLSVIREIINEHRERHKKWNAKAKAVEGSSRASRLVRESGRKQKAESPSENKSSREAAG